MWTRLPLIVALSLLGVAPAVMQADASESRVGILSIACDGTNKHVSFNATALGNSVTRLIQGGEVTVIGTPGALAYVVVRALGDEKKQVITLGTGSTSARIDFTGFIQAATDASGQMPIAVDAACIPGAGSVQAIVTVYYF
jgi:hypothetical protein